MQPMTHPAHVATWYAKGLPNPEALTAASRVHPRGTVLRVHHNKAWVDVVVNDYGPEAWTNRDLDLSRGAFRRLAALGVGVLKVRIEVLRAGEEDRGEGGPAVPLAVRRGRLEALQAARLPGPALLGPWWSTTPHRVQETGREPKAVPACRPCEASSPRLRRGGSR